MGETWKNTALVIIDVQHGLFTGKTPIYHEEQLLKNLNYLAQNAQTAHIPVIYIQHSNNTSLKKGTTGWNLHPKLQPTKEDWFFHKTIKSTFEETDLHQVLQKHKIQQLVITGTLTNVCVNANCRAAKKLGYSVILVKDAHSCRGDETKGKAIIDKYNQKLVDEGIVTLKTTHEIDFRQ